MTNTIPYGEPVELRVGDTWRWKKSLSKYPGGSWLLYYTLYNIGATISISCTASGVEHLADEDPATTSAYAAARYDWVAKVTDFTDVFTVGTGSMQVLPSVWAALDGRSHARKMLEGIEAMLEGKATAEQLAIITASHDGRSLSHDPEALIKLHSRYANMVYLEDDARRVARGEGSARFIQTRFSE